VRGNNPTNSLANSSTNIPVNNQLWYVDSGCSQHMTGEKSNFLSLAASDGGSVAFGNCKFGIIVSVGKIG